MPMLQKPFARREASHARVAPRGTMLDEQFFGP